jgi:hypothetical protein
MYRCKFDIKLPADTFLTPGRQEEVLNVWRIIPPDGKQKLCPLAYKLCHSPCDALENDDIQIVGGKS